ncbi:hypothetical protein DFH09DRAFT_1108600 [Mycena vulgaris]|nr:hypothetical protein DFH09DRAFT_1108600 [Mycena vulgaris]
MGRQGRSSSQPPRRCRRCPGAPYLSECDHSKNAKARKKSSQPGASSATGQASVTRGTPTPQPPADLSPQTPFNRPQTQCNTTRPPFNTPTNTIGFPQINYTPGALHGPLDRLPASVQNLPPVYQSLLGQITTSPSSTQFMSSPGSMSLNPSPSGIDHLIDPSLVAPIIGTGLSANLIGLGGSRNEDNQVTPSPTPTKIRDRPSKKTPIFGKVKGAYRGSKPLEIVRQRGSRALISDKIACTQRFTRKSRELIERCEDLAQETSCWLFFTAQHVNANEPFLHYSSPRLLRDGKSDIEDITNEFNKLFISLSAARQREAFEMSKKLQDAEAKHASTSKILESTTQDLEVARSEGEEQKKRLEEQEVLIAAYKSLLAK